MIIETQYGRLTVVKRHGSNKRKEKLWLCTCVCGKTTIVKSHNLMSGKTQSCGCLPTGNKRLGLDGSKFSRLTVLSFHHTDQWRTAHYLCKCDCNNEIIVSARNLKTHRTRSCGCLKKEADNNRNGINNPNWNPDRTEQERLVGRNIDEYNEWSLAVKQRNNFTCVACHQRKPGSLASHHLFNYHDYPKLRTEISNGVCLCYQCHMEFHNLYGRRNNTPDQFYEYCRITQ